MSAQEPQLDLVTPTDVRNAKFQLIRRGGYDPAQVDPFLEVIAQTLGGGPLADPSINSEYIHGVRFATVRRGGYLPAQVDAFLDRVIETFDQRTPTDTAPPAPVVPQPQAMPTDAAPATAPAPTPPAAAPAEPTAPVIPAPAAAMPSPSTAAPQSPEDDFDRLRALHRSGVLSDKEFAVLGARVKRRIDSQQNQPVG